MRKVFFATLIIMLLLLSAAACSFNQVKDIHLTFYDGDNLVEETTLFKYNNGALADPQKENYDFLGWYLDAECTQKADFEKIKSDTTLYAGWKSQKDDATYYVVTICDDNRDVIKITRAATVDTIAFPEPPAKEGYVFGEWRGLPEKLTSDIVVYAYYLKICKVVFYVEKGDTTPWSTKTIVEGEPVVLPLDPVKANDDQYTYTFSGWSESFEYVYKDLNVYAVFSRSVKKYSYSFVGDGNSVLKKNTVDYGATVSAPIATKPMDENFIYVFSGWDLNEDGKADELPNRVTDNFRAVALFTPNPRSFSVKFYNEGVLLYTHDTVYQTAAEYIGDTPVKQADEQYTYTFSGWDADFSCVEQELSVNANFVSEIRSYTYCFTDNGREAKRLTAEYGTVIVAPQPEGLAQTVEFSYAFDGWQGFTEGMLLTSDCSFTSAYTPVKRTYTYKFYFGNTIVKEQTLEYNSVIVAPEPPDRENYVFIGWSGGYTDGMLLVKNEEFTAVYKAE